MIIVWSEEAKDAYGDIIDDILKKWPLKTVLDFENRTNNLLDSLKINKKLCPLSKVMKLRKCIIHKNVSLIYKTTGKSIQIVTFIFNRDNHEF